MILIAQIPLGSPRLVRRIEGVETSVSNRAVRQARHSQNAWARHVKRDVSRRDDPSGIWAYAISLTLLVGMYLVKIVPEMTYYVSDGTLNLTHSLRSTHSPNCRGHSQILGCFASSSCSLRIGVHSSDP